MKNKKEKIKVTPEELGKVLCVFSHNMTCRYLDDEEMLQGLGIKKIEGDSLYHQDKKKRQKTHLGVEIVTALFYFTVLQIDELFKGEEIGNRILDSMREAHHKVMDLDEAGINIAEEHFVKRYEEYTDASEEKRGPNWLWPVTHHILNNLRQEKTEDWRPMAKLMIFLENVTVEISDLIKNKYEIVNRLS
ncbi:hypothetical protein ES705_49560 [subsurface metagenome]|nr:MAG: hypothetical protein ES695_06680 [Candidatus Atribacteria bacterium 1244-E10-H5-B2]